MIGKGKGEVKRKKRLGGKMRIGRTEDRLGRGDRGGKMRGLE